MHLYRIQKSGYLQSYKSLRKPRLSTHSFMLECLPAQRCSLMHLHRKEQNPQTDKDLSPTGKAFSCILSGILGPCSKTPEFAKWYDMMRICDILIDTLVTVRAGKKTINSPCPVWCWLGHLSRNLQLPIPDSSSFPRPTHYPPYLQHSNMDKRQELNTKTQSFQPGFLYPTSVTPIHQIPGDYPWQKAQAQMISLV